MLPSKIELFLEERRKALNDIQNPREPKQFQSAVQRFLEASYHGAVELDRLWKLLIFEPSRRMRFTILNPSTVEANDVQLCIWSKTDRELALSGIEITTDNAGRDIQADLMYADNFRTLNNPTLVCAVDTTNGVLSLKGLHHVIPKDVTVYLQFDAAPSSEMTQCAFDLRYKYA